ncbi:MAG: adenylate/guanylate cyclase domain-containing protein, partial [Pseudobdellovibrionaceae bacterium]
TLPDSIPLLSLGIPLFRNTEGKITHVAIADIHLGRIQKAFSQISERTLFLVDKRGITLAHPDENLALTRTTFKDSPIFKMSSDSVMPKGQLRFQDPYNKGFYVGAFSKSFLGVTVVSQADENVILEPAREVARQAFFITGLVLSASIFFIFLFSITLTSPLEKLVELSKQIAKGNFNVYARTIVRSRDEVGSLAKAFDSMTEGLKERDKVKALFGKFHGSSIAEEVMKKEFKMGGSNKEVIVFFSDIRGFTAYSERHSPEEVVEMLNEYFGVMVKIINKNFGVVDKFIGDAIMAVWGAPKSSKRDCTNAVRACLEMRVALEELNKKRSERGQDPILIGMGLHSGRAISGTIGSTERMEYTVIGDTVNMTSRIEASTKAFGVDLLVSELVHKQVDKNFAMEEAGTATVKGKSEPLRLYKVIGYKDAKGTVETVTTNYSEYAPAAAEKIKVAG